MIDQETRQAALDTFKTILNSVDAKPADRLRAAEGILKLDQDEKDKGLSDILDASDSELLERARGGRPVAPKEPVEDDNPAQ